jgi:hypothetical protein
MSVCENLKQVPLSALKGGGGFSTTLMRRRGTGPDLAAEGCGVVALADAADLVGDGGPAVAVLAHMHGALGVTDEELVAAGPARHGQRLDIGAESHGSAGGAKRYRVGDKQSDVQTCQPL